MKKLRFHILNRLILVFLYLISSRQIKSILLVISVRYLHKFYCKNAYISCSKMSHILLVEEAATTFLRHCHSSPCEGHFRGTITRGGGKYIMQKKTSESITNTVSNTDIVISLDISHGVSDSNS
jgi:hypothetical protein